MKILSMWYESLVFFLSYVVFPLRFSIEVSVPIEDPENLFRFTLEPRHLQPDRANLLLLLIGILARLPVRLRDRVL